MRKFEHTEVTLLSYHPKGDGEAERCIQSFKQTMRCLLAQNRLDHAACPQILRNKHICVSSRLWQQQNSSMDTNLKHKHYIKHQTMTSPIDVNINNNKFYVLSDEYIRCFHVYPLTCEIQKYTLSLHLTFGECSSERMLLILSRRETEYPISDFRAGNIKVFFLEGALLHTLGDSQDRDKTIKLGITVTNTNKIICTSLDTNFGLHIFQ